MPAVEEEAARTTSKRDKDKRKGPRWNARTHEFLIDGVVIYTYKRKATNQFLVLEAFEADDWETIIDTPLDTGKHSADFEMLNKLAPGKGTRFCADGTGDRLKWERPSRKTPKKTRGLKDSVLLPHRAPPAHASHADRFLENVYSTPYQKKRVCELIMNDLNEKYLTFKQVTRALPGRVHLSTLHRRRLRGVHGVKLATVKIGVRRMVAADDLQRFIEAVTFAADGLPQPIRTARQRQRAIEAAEKELAREGVGRSLRQCKVQANSQRDQAQNPTNEKSK